MKFKPVMILIPIALVVLLPYVIMQLWNHIVCDIFSIKSITYWQALGLFVLGRLLFGNFGFGKRSNKHPMAEHLKEKWLNMSEEERHRFKQEWRSRRKDC